MENSTTIQEIIQRLGKLTPVQQKQILNLLLDCFRPRILKK